MLELVPAQCQITTARAPRRLQKPQNLVPVCPCARVPLTAISGDSVPAHASSAAQDGPLVEWSRDLVSAIAVAIHGSIFLERDMDIWMEARDHDDQTLVPAKRRRDKTLKVSVTDSTGQHRDWKIQQAEKETWRAAARQAAYADGAASVAIVNRPHQGGETSSQDMAEHITARLPPGPDCVH
ncbi:hypothetical protein PoMZ_10669, partial [Pyricularia oryzae]